MDQPLGVGMIDVLHPLYSGEHVTTIYTWAKRKRRETRRWSIGILTLQNLWIYDAWGLRVGTKEHCPVDRQAYVSFIYIFGESSGLERTLCTSNKPTAQQASEVSLINGSQTSTRHGVCLAY